MIRLLVDEYCHNCPNFEPYAMRASSLDGFIDTRVVCEYHDKCKSIKKYLISIGDKEE